MLNLCYLEIIGFLHSCYHPKVIVDILKNVQKISAPVLMRLYDNGNESEAENE